MSHHSHERGALHIFGFLAFLVIVGLGLLCLVELGEVTSLRKDVSVLERKVDLLEAKLDMLAGRSGR